MLNRSNIETKVIPMSTQMFPMPRRKSKKSSVNNAAAAARYFYFGDFHLDVKKAELFKEAHASGSKARFFRRFWPCCKSWRIVTAKNCA